MIKRKCCIIVASVVLLLLCVTKTARTGLSAHFLRDGRLESLLIEAESVRTTSSRLSMDGWAFESFDATLQSIATGTGDACGNLTGTGQDDCIRAHLATVSERMSRHATAVFQAAVKRHLPHSDSIRCTSIDQWVIFSRHGSNPQNVHYDTVSEENTPCEEMDASDRVDLRVWLPIQPVEAAPLLIAATAGISACSRQADATPNQ